MMIEGIDIQITNNSSIHTTDTNLESSEEHLRSLKRSQSPHPCPATVDDDTMRSLKIIVPAQDYKCSSAYQDVSRCIRQFKGQASPCRTQWKKLLDCNVHGKK